MLERPLQQGGKPWSKAPGSSSKSSHINIERWQDAFWALAACCFLTSPPFLGFLHPTAHSLWLKNSVHWRHLNIWEEPSSHDLTHVAPPKGSGRLYSWPLATAGIQCICACSEFATILHHQGDWHLNCGSGLLWPVHRIACHIACMKGEKINRRSFNI